MFDIIGVENNLYRIFNLDTFETEFVTKDLIDKAVSLGIKVTNILRSRNIRVLKGLMMDSVFHDRGYTYKLIDGDVYLKSIPSDVMIIYIPDCVSYLSKDLFKYFSDLVVIGGRGLVSCSEMFCESEVCNLNLDNFYTDKAVSFVSMFDSCSNLSKIEIALTNLFSLLSVTSFSITGSQTYKSICLFGFPISLMMLSCQTQSFLIASWPNINASSISSSLTSAAPASTMLIASFVPATAKLISDFAFSSTVGLITNLPSTLPT